MKKIPVKAAKAIAEKYGYHQVVVIARCVGDNGGEHVTTYGTSRTHCDIAARIGDFLKFKVMGWLRTVTPEEPPLYAPAKKDGIEYCVSVRYLSTDGTVKTVTWEEWRNAKDVATVQVRDEPLVVISNG